MFSESWAIIGRFRKLMSIVIHGRNNLLQFTHAISLRQALADQAWDDLDRRLLESMDERLIQLRRAIIGPDLSHRRTLVSELLRSVPVKRAIVATAKEEGINKEDALARARKYADELAANYSANSIKVFSAILSSVWNKLYDGIEIGNMDCLQQVVQQNGVIYVPCHRSHIDYLLLSYVLYTNSLVPPHIAAGINLNLPLVGPFLRSSGAFFMRRSFKDNPLYSAVFREYLHSNFVRGVSVEYFVEGGRSRTGRMLSPRPGMLQMTVRSYLRDSNMPLVFVPVYIGYEKLIESKTYIKELSGKEKKKESVIGMARSFLSLRGSFGKVYLNFGEPIHLSEELNRFQPDWKTQNYDTDYRPDWLNSMVNILGHRIVTRINEATAVNPINLVAQALLCMPKHAMGEAELIEYVDILLTLLKALPYSEFVTLSDMTARETVAYVERTGTIVRLRHEMGDILMIEDSQSVLMTYYRNNVLHLSVLPALVASCFLNGRELRDAQVKHLAREIYPFMRRELRLNIEDKDLDDALDKAIRAMLDIGLLVRQRNARELCRPVSTSLEATQLRVLAQTVRPMLERYYIGVFILKQAGSGQITLQDLETKMQSMAKRISLLFELNSPDYFDKALCKHFTDSLSIQGLTTLDENEKLVFSERLEKFNVDTKTVLNQHIRHSIHQMVVSGEG